MSLLKPVLAATGHRPGKLGGYGTATNDRLVRLAAGFLGPIRTEVDHVISGLAMGWDMAWAEGAINLGIPVLAAVPFPGQERRWQPEEQERYRRLLSRCWRVQNICLKWDWGAYRKRNRWMVDNSDKLIALWDGSKGGTGHCVRYADATGKPIQNLWSEYELCLRTASAESVRPAAPVHGCP